MNLPLVMAGLAMGVAASPHCAAMCGAPCAALTSACRRDAAAFHLGRVVSYMAGGALAAGSLQWLGVWSQALPALKPLWMLVQLAFLALGLWWLVTGASPQGMTRAAVLPVRIVPRRGSGARPALAGLAWVAWPCGASQAALWLSAMAGDAAAGAMVMAAFALGSMPALAMGPWVWARWRRVSGTALSNAAAQALGYRIAGLALVLGSGWALSEGIWQRVASWCGV
jgi:sulfite exporter TauE/SafE